MFTEVKCLCLLLQIVEMKKSGDKTDLPFLKEETIIMAFNPPISKEPMIYKYPHKILLTPSDKVTLKEGEEILELLKEEVKGIKWGKVVGLAAPQIGINKNVFLSLGKSYFNPVIVWYSPETQICKEGCYSLEENKFDYPVVRHEKIEMEWMSKKGNITKEFFTGFEAQVLQHEYDHLIGKLCCGN